jgi:prepilin-type processing-associated H-X9-DG protein
VSAANSSKLSQLIEEETIIVAQIDLTQIDLDKIDLAKFAIPEPLLQNYKQKIITFTKQFKEVLAVSRLKTVYLIGNIKTTAFYFAVLKTDDVNLNVFYKIAEIRETADFKLIIPILRSKDIIKSKKYRNRVADLTVPRKNPKLRKEFEEALNAVEGYPIKIAISIPEFVKYVLRETKPIIFEDDKKVDFSLLLNLFCWQAIGIDPLKPEIHAVTESQTENKSQEYLTEVNDFLDAAFEKIIKFSKSKIAGENPDNDPIISIVQFLITRQKIIRDQIIPKLQGKSLVLHYSPEDLKEIFKKFSSDFATIFTVLQNLQTRDKCRDSIKHILIAFHNYHDVNNMLPPAFTVDANGKRLHSWRVLILPYIEQNALYKSIRLNEPWDSEYNKQFHDKMPEIYQCPENNSKQKNRDTIYCVVVGKDVTFKENGKGLSFEQITDGTSNTGIIFERKEPVCWMKPEDIAQEDAFKGINKGGDKGIRANHGKTTNVGWIDGSVQILSEDLTPKILRAILTPTGGEVVDWRK